MPPLRNDAALPEVNIHLDRNPFEFPVTEINEFRVLLSVIDGKTVDAAKGRPCHSINWPDPVSANQERQSATKRGSGGSDRRTGIE